MEKKKKINLEIERKFLLKNLPMEVFENRKHELIHIIQYYFLIDGIWQRFRISRSGDTVKYIHTIKYSISPGVFQEDEKEISKEEFLKNSYLYKKGARKIEKIRYVIKHKGLKFEIDVYRDLCLITLEVELPKIDHVYETPKYISKKILLELTGMKQFSNFSLSKECKIKYNGSK